MKSSHTIIIVVLCVALFSWFFYSRQTMELVQNTDNLLHYSNDTYGISFSYPSDYILSEQDIPSVDNLEKYHQVTLMNKKFLPLPVNGEGPTAITIDFYENDTNKYTALRWAHESKESNLRFGEGIIATTTVAGFPAISFRWSGLYEGTTIVLAKPNVIYTFTVTYSEMGSPIIQDFVKIRDSVQISEN